MYNSCREYSVCGVIFFKIMMFSVDINKFMILFVMFVIKIDIMEFIVVFLSSSVYSNRFSFFFIGMICFAYSRFSASLFLVMIFSFMGLSDISLSVRLLNRVESRMR